MKDKICLVTGASSGIGKATALGLAKMDAKVVIVCRNKEKCEITIKEIEKETENAKLDSFTADLSSMKEVKKLAKDFKKKYKQLDVLVLNAGAYFSKRNESVDGFEMTTTVNFLSRFLLTNLLLGRMKASTGARIISIVGSHQAKEIDFNDFMMEKNYKARQALAQSTLANLLFMYELSRKLKKTKVTINCVDPGFVRTNFVDKDKDMHGALKFMFKFFKPFGKSPKEAAETILYVVTSADLNNSNGKYFADMKEIEPSPESQDETLAKELWKTAKGLLKN